MPPKKKGGRKKEQPPLSVQGLLHLEASFVAPSDGGDKLSTVTLGSGYGYGDGAGHVPAEVAPTEAAPAETASTEAVPTETAPTEAASGYGYGDGAGHVQAETASTEAVPQAGPHGDSPAPAAAPTPAAAPAPPPAAVLPPTNGALYVPPPPPPPPPDMDDPDMYEPPDFATEAATADSGMDTAPTVHTGDSVTPVENGLDAVSNGTLSAPTNTEPDAVAIRLAPQAGLTSHTTADTRQAAQAELASHTPAAGHTPVPASPGVIRAAPALRPSPADPVTASADPSGGCAVPASPLPPDAGAGAAAGWHGQGQMNTQQLVAAAAAAADPAGHWGSGAQHPHAESASAPAAATTATTAATTTAATTATATAATITTPPPIDPLSEAAAAGDGLLQHYWQFVRENQYDFNGWTYLLQHVEKQTNLDAIRAVYNAFLPLYPYCYAYWKKYADLELRSGYFERSLQILERAVRAIPLSVELWMALLNQFRDQVKGRPTALQEATELCERAVRSAGSQFRADALWECFIQSQTTNGTLAAVTAIYRRLLKIPTRLYNRHWDNFLQHVRDYHPRDVLEREEYLQLRRQCCIELNMPYREEPAFELPPPTKIPKPEVKLISAMKEKLVAEMVPVHEATERKAEKRWKLEEKIKRPYFHVVPLDRRQLRTWRDYLELEAADGDHHSLVQLYERCLIACAQYEEFWMHYARYLERHLRAATGKTAATSTGAATATAASTAAAAATTAASTASSASAAVSAGTTATAAVPAAAAPAAAANDASVLRLLAADQTVRSGAVPYETQSRQLPEERPDVAAGYTPLQEPADVVREVYKRACLVHCPTKPNVRLQWAAFEESVEAHRRRWLAAA